MRKLISVAALVALLPCAAFGQSVSAPAPAPDPIVTPTPLPNAVGPGPVVEVGSGDQIGVRLLSNIGSRVSNEGDVFAVETLNDYYSQGRLILPKGTPGYGTVTHVKRAGLFHSGGELSINVKRLVAPDGKDFLVEVQGATGGANKDTEVNGNSFGQYLMWGFAGLITKKGNDILLKKGAEFHVVTADNRAAEVIPYGTRPAAIDPAYMSER